MKKKVTDLTLFDYIKENRPVKVRYANKLAKSIEKDNMLEQNPLIVVEENGRYLVIDGQHRLKAANILNIPVWVETVSKEDAQTLVDKIHRLNTYRLNWTNVDYVESYVRKGIESYKVLKEFCKKYHLSLCLSVCMLMDEQMRLEDAQDVIRSGSFNVKRLDQATEEADNLNALSPYVESNIWHTIPFISAVKIAWEKVGVSELREKLDQYPEKIRPRSKTREYLRDLEDRIRYRSPRSTIRLY